MTDDEPGARRGGEWVYDALLDAGIELLVGLPGTQTLPLDRTVSQREEMRYVMARHETGIPHYAWGYYEAGGTPAATLTVPGPGDTNAMHGLKNARNDCVPIVHVSADVNPEDRGKNPIHEIEAETFDHAVKENVSVERPVDLPAEVARGIGIALTEPFGPVRLGVPSRILDESFVAPTARVEPERIDHDNAAAYDRALSLLAGAERPVLHVGGGARRSAGGARVAGDLARALDAPVVATYKGKGVFPEDDDRFLGVMGGHLPTGARRALDAADVVLSLGSDFDGPGAAGWTLPMGDHLVHVNLDRSAIGRAYEADAGIVADVTEAGDVFLDRLAESDPPADRWSGERIGAAVRDEYRDHLSSLGLYDEDASPARTPAALEAIRGTIPRDTIVATDVGGFRVWATQVFPAYAPEAYITAGSWAGMGVGLPAAFGAKLARPDSPVVCLTGDGGLMMCIGELHTAVEEALDVVTVVFNNRDYGIISKSPKIREYTAGHEFEWGTPDFAAIAEGFGARGTSVSTVGELTAALEDALARQDGPEVIDLAIDTEESSAGAAAEYESAVEPGRLAAATPAD